MCVFCSTYVKKLILLYHDYVISKLSAASHNIFCTSHDFFFFLEGNYDQGKKQSSNDASEAGISCPSFYDSLFETPDQINFEQNFPNTLQPNVEVANSTSSNESGMNTNIVSFINNFVPPSD